MEDNWASKIIGTELREASDRARLYSDQLRDAGRSPDEVALMLRASVEQSREVDQTAKGACGRVALIEEAERVLGQPGSLGQRGDSFSTPEGRNELAERLARENNPVARRIDTWGANRKADREQNAIGRWAKQEPRRGRDHISDRGFDDDWHREPGR